MNFPTMCVDDFYSDPDAIREYALKQEFSPSPNGAWPGKRTEELWKLDDPIIEEFCHKIFSLYFDLSKTTCHWKVSSVFQLIEPYDSSNESIKNQGWVHYDNALMGGIIYLTPNPDIETGTSLCELALGKTYDNVQETKQKFYKGESVERYGDQIKEHNDCFVETVKFGNVYNRMICFDGNVPHKANGFYNAGVPRLTQVFFLEDFESDSIAPINRHRMFL